MSDVNTNETEGFEYTTPPEIVAAAAEAKAAILPQKSLEKYELAYRNFMTWRSQNKLENFSETVLLAYMKHLSISKKPSTLWSVYSMLRSTLSVKNNVKISGYVNLLAFLKGNSKGFKPKKSSAFTSEEVKKFLLEASDSEYLATKVAMIFGIYGACRLDELTNLSLNNFQKQGELLLVNIPETKTDVPRSFVVGNQYRNFIDKYEALRPTKTKTDRFFLGYKNEKCTVQPIGRNTFAKMPQKIAKYLNLPNADSYTGHCFRRTSATILANSGATMSDLKRHRAWKSPAVVEGYIADSVGQKKKTMEKIASEIQLSSNSNLSHQNQEAGSSGVKMSNPNNHPSQKHPTRVNSCEKEKTIENIASAIESSSSSGSTFPFPEFEMMIENETINVTNSSNQIQTNESEQTCVNQQVSGQDMHFHFSSCSNFTINFHTHKS